MLTNKKDENFIRISNLVQISNNDNELFIDCYFSRDKLPSLLGRYEVICWIIQVASTSNLKNETRDTAVQIYDKYIANFGNYKNKSDSEIHYFLSLVSTTSLLLSSKIHETQSMISLSKFKHFQEYELINFERQLLNQTLMNPNFSIVSSNTPTNFIDILLRLVEDITEYEINMFAAYAEDLLVKFWEINDSMFFSSITISFSLLLKTFKRFNKDINLFLKSIPENILQQFYNVEKCCIYIEKIAVEEERQYKIHKEKVDTNQSNKMLKDRSESSSPQPEVPCVSETACEEVKEVISIQQNQVKIEQSSIITEPINKIKVHLHSQSPNSITAEIDKIVGKKILECYSNNKRKISDLY